MISIWPSEMKNPKGSPRRAFLTSFLRTQESIRRNAGLDPGSSANAVDLGRMPLIQSLGFRRGQGLVIPAQAGIQVFLIFLGPRPSPG
jgi:hypothetical protein